MACLVNGDPRNEFIPCFVAHFLKSCFNVIHRDVSFLEVKIAVQWVRFGAADYGLLPRSPANTAASSRVRRSIRTETSVRRVCRVRISAASAWASIPGTLRSMPAACRSWGAGALEQFLRGAIDLFFVTVLHTKQPMFSEQRNVLTSTI